MNRPSFQFYPGDWLSNHNLRRCSFHLKGIWIDVLCLLHDSKEYGILRWKLQEIADAIKCSLEDLEQLVRYNILKGNDKDGEKVSFSISLSNRNNYPYIITLIDSVGPLWFSSRMIRDEHIRQKRAVGGIKSLENTKVPRKKDISENIDKDGDKDTLFIIDKDTLSPSPSSSSSSSINTNTNTNTLSATFVADDKSKKSLTEKVSNTESKLTSANSVETAIGDNSLTIPDMSGTKAKRQQTERKENTGNTESKLTSANSVETAIGDNSLMIPDMSGTKAKRQQTERKLFLNFASSTYQQVFDAPLRISKGKDGQLAKDLISTFGLERLKALWEKFLRFDDKFLSITGRSIGIFATQINKLTSACGSSAAGNGHKPYLTQSNKPDEQFDPGKQPTHHPPVDMLNYMPQYEQYCRDVVKNYFKHMAVTDKTKRLDQARQAIIKNCPEAVFWEIDILEETVIEYLFKILSKEIRLLSLEEWVEN